MIMQHIFQLILQAPSPTSGGGMYGNLLLIGMVVVFLYFFMIRPQQKKSRDQRNFLSELKKGDKLVTIGGIHGKIIDFEQEAIKIEVDKGTVLKIDKSAVSLESSKKLAAN